MLIHHLTLRKHAYSNILRILPPKNKNFQMKNSGSFHISALNTDFWYLLEPPWRGDSNKYPQSMFLSRNKKSNVYPCKPQFYCIKVGFMGSIQYSLVFVMICVNYDFDQTKGLENMRKHETMTMLTLCLPLSLKNMIWTFLKYYDLFTFNMELYEWHFS